MAVYDLRKRTKASSGQRHVIDTVAEPVCACSKKNRRFRIKDKTVRDYNIKGHYRKWQGQKHI